MGKANSRGQTKDHKQRGEEEMRPLITTTPPSEEGNVGQDTDKQRKRQKEHMVDPLKVNQE